MAHCLGHYAPISIGRCCDYIYWLSKFHKLPKDDVGFLADWACVAMGTFTADEEQAFWDEYAVRKEQGRI